MAPRPARLALLVAALLAAPAGAAAAPAISGANSDVWNAADPPPTYTVSSTTGALVQWRLDGGAWSPARSSPVVVTVPVADGQHALAAREASLLPPVVLPGPAVQRRFRVDTTPPTVAVEVPAAGATYAQGQAVATRYSCAGAVSCDGPVPSGQPLPTSAAGPAAFVVRATDDAGNVADARVDYVVAPPPPAGSAAQVIRLAPGAPPRARGGVPVTRNARLLSPPAGSRVETLTPLLSWRPRTGARLYNLQIYVVEGATLRKIVSRFPARARARVARGKLAFGRRYVWRAWPYLARGYARLPVGLSYFDVGRPVRLTAAQLLVAQRIAQAALRRVAAVERWLDEGLVEGDLRDGGLGRSEFAGGVSLAGAGAPIANGLATPRPLVEPRPPRAAGRAVLRVSPRQLLVNQRISQAALRRAGALERRLASGLTAGDLRDGAVTAAKLAPGLSVAAAASGPPVAASTTPVPAARRRAGRVRLSDGQALINQRISQAAVRRANRLWDLAEGGLSGAQFRDGTIGAAKLARELRR